MFERVRGVQNLEFDTLGVGYFDASNAKFEPTIEMVQAAIDKKKVRGIRVRSVEKVELAKAIGSVELSVQGLG